MRKFYNKFGDLKQALAVGNTYGDCVASAGAVGLLGWKTNGRNTPEYSQLPAPTPDLLFCLLVWPGGTRSYFSWILFTISVALIQVWSKSLLGKTLEQPSCTVLKEFHKLYFRVYDYQELEIISIHFLWIMASISLFCRIFCIKQKCIEQPESRSLS